MLVIIQSSFQRNNSRDIFFQTKNIVYGFAILLTVYCLLFVFLTWRNFNFALAFLFFCLPTYLIASTGLSKPYLKMIGLYNYLANQDHKIISHLISYLCQYPSLATATALLAATISVFTNQPALRLVSGKRFILSQSFCLSLLLQQ